MRKKLLRNLAVFSMLFLLILLSTVILLKYDHSSSDDSSRNLSETAQQIPIKGMTFNVRVPKNTPDEDKVYIFLHTGKKYPLKESKAGVFTTTLTYEQLAPEGSDGIIRYRYTRNGADYVAAEYLEPDTNDYFWTERGRKAVYKEGEAQNDAIIRWRWFPEDDVKIKRTTEIEPTGAFLPRVGGKDFLSGQIIEDFYTDAFSNTFDSTALHLREEGYNYVEIDPPLQWLEKDGLPYIGNDPNSPNYPDDKTLIEEIQAYKKNGMYVTLAPQLCCIELSTEDRSIEWWNAYFKETTNFLAHFATLAEAEGVDSFHYAIGKDYVGLDFGERWSMVFDEIRKNFSGEVGEMVWNLGSTPGEIIPDIDYITWGDKLDYFYVAIDTPISLKDNPTNGELKDGANQMLEGLKHLYEEFGKPVRVQTTYFNVAQTWKGNTFYSISDVPWAGSEEKEVAQSKYSLSGEDLVRVVNAYFLSISERPWITGYSQFGYTHWENPLVPDLSVRGKPAEDLWRKWNSSIFK